MNIVWTYVAIALATLVAAMVIVGGESASAELKLAEAATTAAAAGVTVICFLAGPAAGRLMPERPAPRP